MFEYLATEKQKDAQMEWELGILKSCISKE